MDSANAPESERAAAVVGALTTAPGEEADGPPSPRRPLLDDTPLKGDLRDAPRRRQRPRLMAAGEVMAVFPELALDRPWILGGYRVHFTPCQCLSSVLYWHNESGNIWTHLFGMAVAAAMTWKVMWGLLLCLECHLSALDRLVMAAYTAGAALCMAASVSYHTFLCCSHETMVRCKRFDYAGVLCLLGASDLPMVYFGFYRHPALQITYLILVTLATACIGGVILSGRFTGLKYNALRHSMFVGLVAVGWAHLVHEVVLKGGPFSEIGRASLMCWARAFSLYGIGFAFFLTKFPERAWPGRFDFLGHSHQLWHVFIMAGAWAQFHNVIIYAQIAKGTYLG